MQFYKKRITILKKQYNYLVPIAKNRALAKDLYINVSLSIPSSSSTLDNQFLISSVVSIEFFSVTLENFK